MTATERLRELRRKSPYAGLLWALRGVSRRTFYWLNRQLMIEAGKHFDASGGRYHFDGMSFVVPKALTSLYFRGFCLLSGYESDEEYAYVDTYVAPDSKVLELGGCLGVLSKSDQLCQQPLSSLAAMKGMLPRQNGRRISLVAGLWHKATKGDSVGIDQTGWARCGQ